MWTVSGREKHGGTTRLEGVTVKRVLPMEGKKYKERSQHCGVYRHEIGISKIAETQSFI